MTHPRRREWAEKVAASAPAGALSVVVDPDPTGTPSALRTFLAAWSSIEPDATHHLVVHDDMALSDTLFERARRAIREMPDAALALFAFWSSRNGGAVRLGALTGSRWVEAVNEYTPCTALILPRAVATGYVEFADTLHHTWPEDVLMYRYLRATGVRTFVGVPNLAEHEDLGSLSGNGFQGLRRSACFLPTDPESSERPILEELAAVPFFKNGVAQVAVRIPGATRPRWQNAECEQYLEHLGVPRTQLCPSSAGAVRGVDDTALRGVWLTSYALGLISVASPGADRRTRAGDARPDPVVVDQAMRTLAPGGLCHLMPPGDLAELQDRLADLIRTGVEAGRDAAARPRRARRPGHRPVAVLGGSSPLGEYLARALTDRGHPVTSVDAVTPDGTHEDIRYVVVGPDGSVVPARSLAHVAGAVDITAFGTTAGVPGWPVPGPTVRVRPAGRAPGAPPPSGDGQTRVLSVGELYGPGCSRHSPLGRMVWDALLNRPIGTGRARTAKLRLLHVKDLAEVLSALFTDRQPGGDLWVANESTNRIDDLAEIIRRVVRPVPVDPRGVLHAVDSDVSGHARAHLLPRDSAVDVEYGIHTFAQWLAYEAEFSLPAGERVGDRAG